MNRIGIMQGRVIPETLGYLQVFPISNWEKELLEMKEMGFQYCELLYDKNLVCDNLLSESKKPLKSWLKCDRNSNKVRIHSICIDQLCLISAIHQKEKFISTLYKIMRLIRDTSIKKIVIPFFGKNLIESHDDFEKVIIIFKEARLDEKAALNGILLALELTLPALQIKTTLKKYCLKNIKICYDLGNATAGDYEPEAEIMELGDLICHVHVKDRKNNGPNVMLGEGDVNFQACFNALKKIEFQGLLILETRYFTSPLDEALMNLNFVKKQFGGF